MNSGGDFKSSILIDILKILFFSPKTKIITSHFEELSQKHIKPNCKLSWEKSLNHTFSVKKF